MVPPTVRATCHGAPAVSSEQPETTRIVLVLHFYFAPSVKSSVQCLRNSTQRAPIRHARPTVLPSPPPNNNTTTTIPSRLSSDTNLSDTTGSAAASVPPAATDHQGPAHVKRELCASQFLLSSVISSPVQNKAKTGQEDSAALAQWSALDGTHEWHEGEIQAPTGPI